MALLKTDILSVINTQNIDFLNDELQHILKVYEWYGYRLNITKDKLINKMKMIRLKYPELWNHKTSNNFGKILKKLEYYKSFKDHNTNTNSVYNIDSNLNISIKIKKIKTSSKHCALIDENNQLYTAGSNTFGQLGNNSYVESSKIIKIENFNNCSEIACGYAYTLIINDGIIYSCGATENGRLGIGNFNSESVKIFTKVIIPEDSKPVSLHAGSIHSVVILENGKLYSWGKRYVNGFKKSKFIPTLLDNFDNNLISSASIGNGGYHTMVLTCSGKVYSWGHNRVGQLGLGFTNDNIVADSDDEDTDEIDVQEQCYSKTLYVIQPQLVTGLLNYKIKQIECAWGHSIVLTYDNKILTCGRNDVGQLGIDPKKCPINTRGHRYINKFTELDCLMKIKRIITGSENISGLINSEGKLFLWGKINKIFHSDRFIKFHKIRNFKISAIINVDNALFLNESLIFIYK